MFTGLTTENTPAIQVWNFQYSSASGSAPVHVSLTDDCARIQFFKTGGSTTAVRVYLPPCPVEGLQIKIVNARYGTSTQSLNLYASDLSYPFAPQTGNTLYVLGAGQILELCYSKNFINYESGASGIYGSGWVSLNQVAVSAQNYYAVCYAGGSSAVAAYSASVGGQTNTSSNAYSLTAGGQNNTASGQSSAVIGSANSTASGNWSSVLVGQSNTASGSQSAVIGGSSNQAQGTNAIVAGGSSNTANSNFSAVVGGTGSFGGSNTFGGVFCSNGGTASGQVSGVFSGNQNVAGGDLSVILGGQLGTTRGIVGNVVFPASQTPIAGSPTGVQQAALLILGVQTTNATTTTLRSNTSAAGTTNQVVLPNSSAFYFSGSVIASVGSGGNTKAWSFEGAIKRGANAAATTLVQSVINAVAADPGAETWTIALSADTTNGALKIDVTGAASTTIRWVCRVQTTEVTY